MATKKAPLTTPVELPNADVLSAYVAVNAKLKELEETKKALAAQIKAAVRVGTKVNIDGYEVALSEYSVARLDTNAIKAAGLYDKFCIETMQQRLSVKNTK